MSEGGPSFPSFERHAERVTQTLTEELERLYSLAETETQREFARKILEMMDAKERARAMARYIATADPKDISTYQAQKKLGILLVCDAISTQDYNLGGVVIRRGDRLLQLHIPPRDEQPESPRQLLADLSESMQLTSDYIKFHGLKPRFITGCTYEPLVTLAERRHGFGATRINIPYEWSDRVRDVFHRYVDPTVEPEIGFIYQSAQDFQERFPPRS